MIRRVAWEWQPMPHPEPTPLDFSAGNDGAHDSLGLSTSMLVAPAKNS